MSKDSLTWGLLAAFLLCLCSMANSGSLGAQEDSPVALQWNGVPLEKVVEEISDLTGRRFLYDEQIRQKRVYLMSPEPVPREAVYQVFQAALEMNGFASVPVALEDGSEVIKIVPGQTATTKAVPAFGTEEVGRIPREDQVITQVIPLRYADPRSVQVALATLVSNPRNALPIEGASAVIVTDYATNVLRIVKVIELLDRKPPDIELEVVALEKASATDLEPKLDKLFQTLLQQAAPGRQVGAPGTPTGERLQIVADQRTNSLIVLGLRERIEQVKQMVRQLDVEAKIDPRQLHIYKLKHAKAKDLATTLTAIYSGQAAPTREGAPGAALAHLLPRVAVVGGQPGASTAQQISVAIVADEQNNALLVVAPTDVWNEISDVIDQLDRRRPQVLIEAAFVEVSTTDDFDLGVELATIGRPGDTPRGFGVTNMSLSSFVDSDGDGVPDARVPFLPDGGIIAGIFKDEAGRIPILLSALSRKTKVNVLQVPQVATNDNEEATLSVASEIPIQKTQVATGGATTTTSIDFEPAQTELKITPHISSDNYLQLDIALSVNEFSRTVSSPTGVPAKITRKVDTTVTVPNRRTVVIGGLTKDKGDQGRRVVPILGDIPYLGELFTRRSEAEEKQTIYVFLTPYILVDDRFLDFEELTKQRQEAVMRLSERRSGEEKGEAETPGPADAFEYRSPYSPVE